MTAISPALQRSSRRNARTEPSPPRLSKAREQGQWSFLTWSFFLSQLVAVEQAAAAAASADPLDPARTQESAVAGAGANPKTGLLPPEDVASAAEAQGGATPAPAPVSGIPGTDVAALSAPDVGPEGDADWAANRSDQGQAIGASLVAGLAAVPDAGSPPSPDLPLAWEAPPLLNPVVGPVAEIVGDVIDVLDPVVDGVVAPVLGLVGDLVGDVVQVLDPVVDSIVAPVLGLAGDVLADVIHVLDPVVDGVIAPVFGVAGNLLGDAAQGLDPILDGVSTPVLDSVGGPLSTLLGLIPAGGEASGHVVVGSSGSLDFEVTPLPPGQLVNELFKGGSYTEYGLSLHADGHVGTSSAPGLLGDPTAPVEDVLAVTDLSPGQQAAANQVPASLPHLLGDIGLHGLGL